MLRIVCAGLLVSCWAASSRAAPAISFTDVTKASGVVQVYQSKNPSWGLGGIAILDVTGDGALDLVIAGGDGFPVRVWAGTGPLTFVEATSAFPFATAGAEKAVAPADFDDDGDLDLLVTCWDEPMKLFRRGPEGWDEVSAPLGLVLGADKGTDVSWGDVDRDGRLDLFVGRYAGILTGPRLFVQKEDGTFADESAARGVSGYVVVNKAGKQTNGANLDVQMFDADNDGDLDIYIANDRGYSGYPASMLYVNDGTGHFVDLAPTLGADALVNAMGAAIGDLDGDGYFDIYITNTQQGHVQYMHGCDGYANTALASGTIGNISGWGTLAEDYDLDGHVDLYVAHDTALVVNQAYNHLYHNLGGGLFEEIGAESDAAGLGSEYTMTVSGGDLDQDGDVDLVIQNDMGPIKVLRNDSPGEGHWLHVELEGTASNRDGIGARVEVEAGGRVHHRQLMSTTTLLGTNQFRLFFGLGESTVADRVTVRWPLGTVSTLAGVAADQVIHVIEEEKGAAPALLSERCGDGIDNDCDGTIDFPEEGADCLAETAGCPVPGVRVCTDSGPPSCVPLEPPGESLELCGDGLDDDCDGSTDEGFEERGEACTAEVSGCVSSGVLDCSADLLALVCTVPGSLVPILTETCGGADEDCDGATDEGFEAAGTACLLGLGACETAGAFACGPTGADLVCEPFAPIPEPGEELCNLGLDDDCDGETDEGFEQVGSFCSAGAGICQADGVVACAADGLGEVCFVDPPAPEPGLEVCANGLDDDCDGHVDNGSESAGLPCTGTCGLPGTWVCASVFGGLACETGALDVPGALCEVGIGACAVPGLLACDPAGPGFVCVPAEAPPEPGVERCGDGIDDDCDGETDEGFETPGSACTVGTGACEAEGIVVCLPSGLGTACLGIPAPPGPERCENAADDDCDGATDEGFEDLLGVVCENGVGACAAPGVTVCGDGGLEVACAAVPGPPSEEHCGDGSDDDCDGEIDEGFADAIGLPCSAGVGACRDDGEIACADHGYALACTAVPGAPGPEVPNGLDDDCDGLADEGLVPDVPQPEPEAIPEPTPEPAVPLPEAGAEPELRAEPETPAEPDPSPVVPDAAAGAELDASPPVKKPAACGAGGPEGGRAGGLLLAVLALGFAASTARRSSSRRGSRARSPSSRSGGPPRWGT